MTESRSRLKELVNSFPPKSGVYLMRNADGEIIYIGKAKKILNRVRSYFSAGKDVKTTVLMQNAASIDYIVTENEYEALLLENTLIKKWNPRYNINLKDGKSYPVIRITHEDFPRVFRTRRIIRDGSEYFGPFPNVQAVDSYLQVIERSFPLRKCRGSLKERKNPCLYYHIGRCGAPCVGKTTKEEYGKEVAKIRLLLEGKTEDLISTLEQAMEEASTALNFEVAAKERDTIKAIKEIDRGQKVVDFQGLSRDYISYVRRNDHGCFTVFQMREGRLSGKEAFVVKVYDHPESDFEQFLIQYYTDQDAVPDKVILGKRLETVNFSRYLLETLKREPEVTIQENEEKRAILDMVEENARQELEKRLREFGDPESVKALQEAFELEEPPVRIEGFDIAHLHGKFPVASMVSFLNGVPDKKEYRKFHVKTLDGLIDDFEAMREITARRYSRVLNDKLDRPNLILIDGGKGQVNAVFSILESLGLQHIPLAGLAKKEEHIFFPHVSEPLILEKGSPELRLLQYIRDESHRFATTFNQQLRESDMRTSILESIPGIGPKRKTALLKKFGSLEKMALAGKEEVAKAAGIKPELAEKVVEILKRISS